MTRDELIAAHIELPERTARSMGLSGRHDFDDLVGAARETLVEAAGQFDPARSPTGEAGAGPFLAQRVRWRLCDELKTEGRRREASLDAALGHGPEEEGGLTLGAALADTRADDPAAAAAAKDQVRRRGYHSLRLAEARKLAPRPEGVGAWAQKLREAAFNAVRESDITELMQGLIERAKAGDLAAARLVLTYLTGGGAPRVQQVVLVQQNASRPPAEGGGEVA